MGSVPSDSFKTGGNSHHMKFSELPYSRPDLQAAMNRAAELTGKLRNAEVYEEARESFLEMDREDKKLSTQSVVMSSLYVVEAWQVRIMSMSRIVMEVM